MKREYTIIIEAKGSHQPSQDEIFQAVKTLVDNRVKAFPKRGSGTDIAMIPGPIAKLLRKFPRE